MHYKWKLCVNCVFVKGDHRPSSFISNTLDMCLGLDSHPGGGGGGWLVKK